MVRVGTALCLVAAASLMSGPAGQALDVEDAPVIQPDRPGTVLIVEITVGSPAEIDVLTEAGFLVTNVRGSVVTLYATADEVAQLRARGYGCVEVGRQPGLPEVKKT